MEHQHAPVPTHAPEGMSHDSADYEYAFTPEGAGYEHTDANVWILVKFALWLLISALVIHAGLYLAFALFVEQREAVVEPEFPLAVEATPEPRLPAGARLQRQPANEIFEFRQQENAILHGYGWVDKNAGTVRIPIDEAMRLTLERGLPSRAVSAEGGAVAEVPGMMPQDSSAGRTSERRRQ
jgi:hypothetical protein